MQANKLNALGGKGSLLVVNEEITCGPQLHEKEIIVPDVINDSLAEKIEEVQKYEWIDVLDEFPLEYRNVLGYCKSNGFTGILEVFFKKNTGWHRVDEEDKKVAVFYWMPMLPAPKNVPWL